MKKTIIEIKQLAALLFSNEDYIKFNNYIENNQINDARLIIDKEVLKYDDCPDYLGRFEISIASKLSDLVIDLIINEMDGRTEGKQIRSMAE
jgi:hypothetical protein